MAHISERKMPEMPGVAHRWLDVRGAWTHIAEAGPPDGAPLILLHGFTQHWYAWHEVVPLLADSYRLICVDLRGFGWSEQTRRGYDIDGLAEDVLALLDALDLPSVGLAGHDWGAQVGFRLCLRAPERVSGFVAVNMVHPWPLHRRLLPNLWRMWFTALLEYPVAGRLVLRHWPRLIGFLMRRETGREHRWEPAELAEFVASTRDAAHAGQQIFWQYVLRDITTLIVGSRRRHRLTVPTLILAGAQDPVIPPELLDGGERHITDLDVRVVAEAGHYLPAERPALVAEACHEHFMLPAVRDHA